jgi:phosphatidylethanolamine/phosphatidyl-N-methylethanolamine N-methyltransferase
MREALFFLGQYARQWRQTGAVAPSSPHLARAMAAQVGTLAPGDVILELGPGTGVFTRELIGRYPGHRVVAVEFNREFANRLRAALPAAIVVEGCASKLSEHIAAHAPGGRVGAVVSGLPLLSLPKDLGAAILAAITDILPAGRAYVQFTYSQSAWRGHFPQGFAAPTRRRVWMNIPPAVVMSFVKT